MALELASTLAGFGHSVAGTAATVDAALSLAEEKEIDVAIVDLELKRGDFGGDVAELLLRRHGVQSIILSAYLHPLNREAVESLGVAGIVRKPFDKTALRALLIKVAKQVGRIGA